MPQAAPTPRRRPRPSRDEILEARKKRRWRLALYCGSIGWAVAVAIGLMLTTDVDHSVSYVGILEWLAPGITAGLLAGRRTWPIYFATAMIATVFAAALPAFATVPALCVFVIVLGYAAHVVRSILAGRAWGRPPPREADDPRSDGSVRAEVGARGTQDASIATASPSGREMPKRSFY